MRVRRLIATTAALALVLGACTSGTPTDTEAVPTTVAGPASAVQDVTLGLQLEPPTLDLTSSPAAAIPQVLLYNVYETLVKLESDGSITGLLAESWDVSDDGTEWTFSLREGVTFHDGQPFSADDVVFSLTNVLEKDPAHPFATTLEPISSVEAIDAATVRITLDRFSANFLFFLTQGQGVILAESAVADIANSAIGTGPFVFEEWAQGDSIVVRRNADYWGTPAFVETITYRYINDPNALNNALLAGDIDIITGVSAPELLEAFEADDRFEVLVGQTNGEVTMALNGSRAPLDDVRVRQAISRAIDRQEIVDLAYFGYGELIGTGATPLDPYYVDLTNTYT
ncbi:MAG: ABC transporter substrate-binding protein, partial [Acidimicrobiia bacterium]|nr:ABC transporter substrate-binding protein [Acidimicrobiia bacterium]